MRRRPEPPRRTRRGFPHQQTLLVSALANVFQELGVGAAVRVDPTDRLHEEWYPINHQPEVGRIEHAYGAERKRWRYNERCFARARQERTLVLGEHGGYSDFFVPLGNVDDSWGTLAVGPFATAPPTSGELLANFRALSGKHGRLGDPGFVHYLSLRLSTLTLEGALRKNFERFLIGFSALLAEGAHVEQILGSLNPLRFKLADARQVETMWEAARSMIDARTTIVWHSPDMVQHVQRLGLKRPPAHALVGLLVSKDARADSLDDWLQRHAFQRACALLARERGGVIVGRNERHGVSLLVEHDRGEAALQVKLVELADRVRALAKRFGLTLHFGASTSGSGTTLPERYRAALSAAERALSEGQSLVRAEPQGQRTEHSLRALKRELVVTLTRSPSQLSTRFQRYLEVAAVHSGYRLEVLRAHLEAGFDALADTLESSAALDQRSFAELCASVPVEAAEAGTIGELAALYQRITADIELALARPKEASRERSLRRAVAYVHDHTSERLSLRQVAKIAGFAPEYFSRLFAESEGVTFRAYLTRLRIERAKSMLISTALDVERVAELCGFVSRVHFHRAFRAAVGATPSNYRAGERPGRD